jgi:long-subunit acyl-CoA synthetase (AMP-forming)
VRGVSPHGKNRPERRRVTHPRRRCSCFATPFSICNTNSPEQINYPLAHAESRVVVCENQDVKPIRDTGYRIDHLVCVDGYIDGGLSLPQLEQASDPGFDFEATWKSVQPTDIVTLSTPPIPPDHRKLWS